MKIAVDLRVEIDPNDWVNEFGTSLPNDEVRGDIRRCVLSTVRDRLDDLIGDGVAIVTLRGDSSSPDTTSGSGSDAVDVSLSAEVDFGSTRCEFRFPDGLQCVFGGDHAVGYHHSPNATSFAAAEVMA